MREFLQLAQAGYGVWPILISLQTQARFDQQPIEAAGRSVRLFAGLPRDWRPSLAH